MPLVTCKSAEQKFIFLISQPKHMLWVLKRTVSMRRFFSAPILVDQAALVSCERNAAGDIS